MPPSYTLLIDRFLASLDPIAAVIRHPVEEEVVVMLADGDRYAVCRLHPGRRVAAAPNYFVESETGLLTATLSKDGLSDLLHWTDRPTALGRLARLTGPHRAPGALTLVAKPRGSPA